MMDTRSNDIINKRRNKKRRRTSYKRHVNIKTNRTQRHRLSFKLWFLVSLSLLTHPNKHETPIFCTAFCPARLRRITPRNSPGDQFRDIIVAASTSLALFDATELSPPPSPSAEALLVQNLQSTLSEIDQFAKTNGVSFNSKDERILSDIHRQQQVDAQTMEAALPSEEANAVATRTNNIPYQWIYTQQTKHPLAIQTKGPILEDSTINWIRQQAHSIWNGPSKTLESRFTYQRKGNYEVHLADLLQSSHDEIAKREIYQSLQERIYPLVRQAFGSSLGEEDPSSLQFCVYDAIVIRYNATEENLGNKESPRKDSVTGAGQPLHRDLGLVSVNVMLNSPKEFEGGGTFMEHQLQDLLYKSDQIGNQQQDDSLPLPLKPVGGPGHALLHLSSDRHAGASTMHGVRDILVFFLTASKKASCDNTNQQYGIPVLEQAARLKSTARSNCEKCGVECDNNNPNSFAIWQPLASAYCRAKYQHLAVQSNTSDGEAWQYLGMALWDIHQALAMRIQSQMGNENTESTIPNLERVFQYYQQRLASDSLLALEMAKKFTPCDARVYHNLAWILDQQAAPRDRIQSHYSRAMELHQSFQRVGCDVGIDYDSTILNYGLYLANQDLFEQAISVLEWIQPSSAQVKQQMEQQQQMQQEQKLHQRLGQIQDAERLLDYCQRRIS